MKFTTQLIVPQSIKTLTLVGTNFLFPKYILAYAGPIYTLEGCRIVSLMSDCVSEVNYVVVNSRERHNWFTKKSIAII